MKRLFKQYLPYLSKALYPLRLFALVLSVMLIYGLFYVFVCAPLSQVNTRLTEKILALKKPLHNLQAQKKHFDRLLIPTEGTYQSQITELKQKIATLDLPLKNTIIPNESNFNETIERLSQTGPSLSNPDIRSLSKLDFVEGPSSNSFSDLFKYQNIELTLYGSYCPTVDYLHSLENLPWIIEMDSFTYTVTTYPYAKIQLVMSVLSREGLTL